jgi:excisionase family DNA binding protein
MPTPPQYISTSRAAEPLGLSREHLRRLIQRGELRAEERVNGFMLDTTEVERYAFQRQIFKDQQQFRAAVDDLAARARHVDGANSIQRAVAQMRDQMKLPPAFEVPTAVTAQLALDCAASSGAKGAHRPCRASGEGRGGVAPL